jgi:hypothetical protein
MAVSVTRRRFRVAIIGGLAANGPALVAIHVATLFSPSGVPPAWIDDGL